MKKNTKIVFFLVCIMCTFATSALAGRNSRNSRHHDETTVHVEDATIIIRNAHFQGSNRSGDKSGKSKPLWHQQLTNSEVRAEMTVRKAVVEETVINDATGLDHEGGKIRQHIKNSSITADLNVYDVRAKTIINSSTGGRSSAKD